MTWDELKQKAKEIGADVFDKFIVFSGLFFDKNGDILFFGDRNARHNESTTIGGG